MEETPIVPNAPHGNLPPKITKENYQQDVGKNEQLMLRLKTLFCLLISSLLISISSYALIAPNHFTTGGVSGLAVLLNIATNDVIKQSWIVLGVNAPLIILSFFYVKKRFAIITTLHILFQTAWLMVLELLFPDFKIAFETGGERIFAALAGGICIGAAIALAFKIGGSTGGTDIIAVMIQKKVAASSIAWMIFILNCMVIGASFFVFFDSQVALAVNILPIMLAIFEAYIESKINDSLTNGFQSAIEFRIITDKPTELSYAIMHELGRGVTALPATGMYTLENHTMLVCVIGKRQIGALRRIMKHTDPDSFAVMSSVSQVVGLGFYISEL
jgi:uncharacterized membrane-anchored protein YitT (DUF2179 family)